MLRANDKIAFTSDRDGNREIYVMNNDGTGQGRLTNNPGVDDYPAWSPDGRKIAFLSENAAGAFIISLMNADGTGQNTLTTIAFSNSPYPWHEPWSMSWSPDGAKIAFEESGEIFTINVDGSNRVNVTNHPAWDIEPSWSPNGSRIAFVSSRAFYLTMHTMNSDGSDVRALPSAGEFWDMSPDWSPTGDKIVFVVHSEDYLPILYTANPDGTNRQPYDGSGIGSEHRNKPKWSPDGTKIVFHIWEYFSNDCEIYVKSVDGTDGRHLTNTTGRNYHPAWQPSPTGPTACSNPIDCAEFFVRQHYLDFLNREPDPGGWDSWTARITECGNDPLCVHQRRIGVSAAFFIELEFQDTGYYVYRFYKASFGRQPNYAEFTSDRSKVVDGSSLEANKQAFADEWVQRTAFTQAYPITMSNTEVVNKLFDTAGLTGSIYDLDRQQEIVAMNAGRSRALVLRDVIEIPDFKSPPDPNSLRYAEVKRVSQYNPAFVLMQYFGYLRRNIDQGGYDFWLDVVDNRTPNNYQAIVCAFLTSAEYQLRFGASVTRVNQDCAQ